MKTFVAVYLALLGLAGTVIVLTLIKVSVSLLGDEAKGWLERLPFGLLVLAARRLPEELRDEQLATWIGDLDHLQEDLSTRPLFRLWTGIRFAVGLLHSAPKIAGAFGWARNVRMLQAWKFGRALALVRTSVDAFTLGIGPVVFGLLAGGAGITGAAFASGDTQILVLRLILFALSTLAIGLGLFLLFRRVRRRRERNARLNKSLDIG